MYLIMSEHEKDHKDVGAYYDQEPVAMAETTGAGLIWFMGRDHLSPPLSNADEYALDSSRWREASSNRVIDLARRMGVTEGDRSLELGCGIGGPGRDITESLHAQVIGLSISLKQLENLRRISQEVSSPYTVAVMGDMQHLSFADTSMDHVYSINAIYHVNDPRAVIRESARVLRTGGRFGVDDWFITNNTSEEQHQTLRHNWSTSSNGFHNFDHFAEAVEQEGFRLIDIIDYTEEAGEFLSEERFGVTYDTQIAPTLREAFPQLYQYEGYEPVHADMAVAQLRSDILYMGELYRTGGAVYRQIVAEKL
jgi:SAM-dependent methyltransferase